MDERMLVNNGCLRIYGEFLLLGKGGISLAENCYGNLFWC